MTSLDIIVTQFTILDLEFKAFSKILRYQILEMWSNNMK